MSAYDDAKELYNNGNIDIALEKFNLKIGQIIAIQIYAKYLNAVTWAGCAVL